MAHPSYAIECRGAHYAGPDPDGPYPFVWTGREERICRFAARAQAEKTLRIIQQFEPDAAIVELAPQGVAARRARSG